MMPHKQHSREKLGPFHSHHALSVRRDQGLLVPLKLMQKQLPGQRPALTSRKLQIQKEQQVLLSEAAQEAIHRCDRGEQGTVWERTDLGKAQCSVSLTFTFLGFTLLSC